MDENFGIYRNRWKSGTFKNSQITRKFVLLGLSLHLLLIFYTVKALVGTKSFLKCLHRRVVNSLKWEVSWQLWWILQRTAMPHQQHQPIYWWTKTWTDILTLFTWRNGTKIFKSWRHVTAMVRLLFGWHKATAGMKKWSTRGIIPLWSVWHGAIMVVKLPSLMRMVGHVEITEIHQS